MDFSWIARAAGAAAALCLTPLVAQAAGCHLAAMTVPVRMDGYRPILDAKVDGKPARFLLDSGAFYDSVSPALAVAQNLKPVQKAQLGTRFTTAAKPILTGAGGVETESRVVMVPQFEFAGQIFTKEAFLVTDIGDVDGVIGQNFLRQTDDEYDLRNGVLRLVRPQDCDKVILAYWAKPGTTFSQLALETKGAYDSHTIGTIKINGVEMRAVFDTGAPTSFITAPAAARAGVKTSDPSVAYLGKSSGIDSDDIKTWVGRFASVRIGDEEIKNAQLEIGDSEAYDWDVLIGADFFLAHHVYVANSQHRLYFTYEGGQVFYVPSPDTKRAPGQAAPQAR